MPLQSYGICMNWFKEREEMKYASIMLLISVVCVFTAAKFEGIISWDWWVVLSPLWFPAVAVFLFIMLLSLVARKQWYIREEAIHIAGKDWCYRKGCAKRMSTGEKEVIK